jgi:sialidase-1
MMLDHSRHPALIIALTCALLPHVLNAQAPVDLDRSGQDYAVFRIPALAVTPRGALLAAYDARPSQNDLPSHIALVMRRSEDGGATWSPRVVLRADTVPLGFGDPSFVVDRRTGRIFLFHAASVQQGFVGASTAIDDADPAVLHADLSWSDDDGLTWRHRRLTAAVKPPGSSGLFAASGLGIQIEHGKYAGRLVQQYAVRRAGAIYAASLYSDDHGDTWHMGALVGPGADESKVVELPDGSLMLNIRARPNRLVALSTDGGTTFSTPTPDPQLPDPSNNGAIIRYDARADASNARAQWLVFSNTADSTQRRNLTLRLSCDGGRTWPTSRVVVDGAAGYSTLAALPGGDMGLLYERGRYEAITFMRLPLAWLGGCP